MNFGIGGFGTAQQYLLLKERVLRYSPDLVVLAFLPINDFTDNVRALDSNSGSRPFASLDEKGEIAWDFSFKDSASFRFRSGVIYQSALWLSDYSRVAQAVFAVRDMLRQNRVLAGRRNAVLASEHGLADVTYRGPDTPDWQHAWNVARRLIEDMRRLAAQSGAGFLLVTLSSGHQARPHTIERTEVSDSEWNPYHADDKLHDFASRAGIDVISLARPMAHYARVNNVFLHGFATAAPWSLINKNVLGEGHWNEEGHRVAGELIAEQLCSQMRPAGGVAMIPAVDARSRVRGNDSKR